MATKRSARRVAFGQWLDVTLSSRRIKGHELAAQVGVDDSAISRWRSGRGGPTMHTCMRLANVLEVDPLRLAATAGLLDGNVTGVVPLPMPPATARRERVRAQIEAIKGLTEGNRQKLLELYDEIEEEDGDA